MEMFAFQVNVGSEEAEREKNQDAGRLCDDDIIIEEFYGTFKIRKKCCQHLSYMKIRKMLIF